MNGQSYQRPPLTDEEITALRERAAGNGVPWDREKLTRALWEKHQALAAARRARRIRLTVLGAALAMLLVLLLLYWISR